MGERKLYIKKHNSGQGFDNIKGKGGGLSGELMRW